MPHVAVGRCIAMLSCRERESGDIVRCVEGGGRPAKDRRKDGPLGYIGGQERDFLCASIPMCLALLKPGTWVYMDASIFARSVNQFHQTSFSRSLPCFPETTVETNIFPRPAMLYSDPVSSPTEPAGSSFFARSRNDQPRRYQPRMLPGRELITPAIIYCSGRGEYLHKA
jgi:hypothetical protein